METQHYKDDCTPLEGLPLVGGLNRMETGLGFLMKLRGMRSPSCWGTQLYGNPGLNHIFVAQLAKVSLLLGDSIVWKRESDRS